MTSKRSFHSVNRMRSAALAALAFLFLAGLAGADAIDDVMKDAYIQLDLKVGLASGTIEGREGDALLMRREGVPFKTPIASLRYDASGYYDNAQRLIGEQMFRRAAIQLGLARLLDPADPRRPALEAEIAGNLGREAELRAQARNAEQAEQVKRARELGRMALNANFPLLSRVAASPVAFLPREEALSPAIPANLDFATSASVARMEYLATARNAAGDAAARLAAARALRQADLKNDDSAARKWMQAPAQTAAIDLCFSGCGGLWTDYLEFQQYRMEYARLVKQYQPPMAAVRERAKSALRMQILAQVNQEQAAANQPPWQPGQPGISADDPVQKRLNAEFIQERRLGEGCQFLSAEGDTIFIPIADWSAIDNPAAPPASAEAGYSSQTRVGWVAFNDSVELLSLVLGAHPGDPVAMKALAALQDEARAVLRDEPGLEAVSKGGMAPEAGVEARPTAAPAPNVPNQ